MGPGGVEGADPVSTECHIPASHKMPEGQWRFQPSSLWFREEQQFLRNLSSKGSFPRVRTSISTNGLRSLCWEVDGFQTGCRVATEGANSGSWKVARDVAWVTEALACQAVDNCPFLIIQPSRRQILVCVCSDLTLIRCLLCGGHQAKDWLLINFV